VTTIQIIRKLLTPDELSNPNQRYNADCDCVQTSYDGGDTWTDTPGADPRHFDGYRFAPTAGMDPRCLSAGNMTDKIKFNLDTIIASATIFGAATAVINILLVVLPGAGILIDLVLATCEALFDIGLATVNAALTTDVYDQLMCILYCAIGDDGQVSATQYATIRAAIDTQIGGVAAVALDFAIADLAEVGLSNAGTIGSSTRMCDDCACSWCYDYLWQSGEADSWNVASGQGGTFFFSSPNWLWDGTLIGSVPSSLGIQALLGDGSLNYHVTDFAVDWTMADAYGTFNDFVRMYDKDNTLVYTFSPGIGDGGNQTRITSTFSGLDLQVARILIRGDARNYVVAYNFHLEGDGVSPFSASNC